MSEWQPIETAPKDGTAVLLWADTEAGDANLRLFGKHLCEVGHSACAQVGQFGDGHWHTEFIGEPTHWQPLPDDPPA